MHAPRRIVSLVASNTEIVSALGLQDRLVGVDDFSDYPAAVQTLPRVGRDLEIDVARVAALEPDLVLASLSVPGMERNLPSLYAAGLPVVVVETAGWRGLWANIRQIGAACGVAERADRLVDALQRRAEAIAERIAGAATRPTVYWEWWPRPTITAGGPSWITEMCRRAGGENCFADLEQESAAVSSEQVLARDPAVIVLCWCGARRLAQTARVGERPGWQATSAWRSGRVHAFLEPHFGRPGPRLLDGLAELAAVLHPERFR